MAVGLFWFEEDFFEECARPTCVAIGRAALRTKISHLRKKKGAECRRAGFFVGWRIHSPYLASCPRARFQLVKARETSLLPHHILSTGGELCTLL